MINEMGWDKYSFFFSISFPFLFSEFWSLGHETLFLLLYLALVLVPISVLVLVLVLILYRWID